MHKYKTTNTFILTFVILTIMTSATLAQENVVTKYIDQLKYKEVSARAYAAYVLGQIGDARAVDPLIPLLNDEDKYVRIIVAEALGKIRDAKAVEALTAALQDKERSVRWSAANALKQISPDEKYEIARYVKDLNDPDSRIRLQAVRKLLKLVPEKAQQYQMTRYINDLKDSDTQVQASAANALGTIGDATAVQPLVTALNDNDALVRRNAVTALSQISLRLKDATVVKPAIESLISLLQDKSNTVSASAVTTLAEIGKPAVESLANASNSDNAVIRAIAVDILGKIHPENLGEYQIPRYIKDLKDQDVSTRVNAALIKIGEPAIRPLTLLLKSQDPSVQLHAAIALREIGLRLRDSSKLNPAKDTIIAAFVDSWRRRSTIRTV